MAKNANLHAAKKAKNDEFYTRYEDIQAELIHYQKHFRGKVVYCNCDDPAESNFVKFFLQVFNAWGIKKLVSTCYVSSPIAGETISALDTDPAAKRAIPYKLIVTQVEDEELISNDRNNLIKLFQKKGNELTALNGDGDFRSDECAGLLKQADIIVTNPPFSLFREYVAQLIKHKKKFVIIGPRNAITTKEIFPLIKDKAIWLGYGFSGGNAYFYVEESRANDFAEGVYDPISGLVHFRNCLWFTNLDIPKRHQPLEIRGNKYYGNEEKYPKYDNYDAINVDKVADIPEDYDGVMGVPITFVDKYCPEQFEIVNANDYRRSEKVPAKPHGLIKDKEAKITLQCERERERERERTCYARICIKRTPRSRS